ncbi:MAG: 1-acyl-sn-glycerol-3-phosphate acyltransferase [Bacteroidetes bacterium]|nr:1-acyl-sn-glycerol-3-phosphate acyltransferase [Bacteroidota bacterium]
MRSLKKMVLNILATLWAVWVLLWFIITLLIILLPVALIGLFPEPQRTRYFIVISRIWMAVFLPLAGVVLRIYGRKKFQKNQPYVVVCNHRSFMDIPVSSPGIPGGNKTIAKVELSKIPLFGIVYKRGSILVDRKSESSRKKSYLDMKQALSIGLHVCLYPEGTRNKTNMPLSPFKDGAFRLAIETQTPLIPAVIAGTHEMLPAGKLLYFKPGIIRMFFLDPVSTAGLTLTDLPALKEKVFQQMWNKLEESK